VERPKEVVLDASVATKWFIDEAGSSAALKLLDAHLEGRTTVVAPTLLVYEVGNALRHHPSLTPPSAAAALNDLFDFQLSLVPPSSAQLAAALQRAYELKLTVYDAQYVVTAEERGCPLITTDGQILKASKIAVRPAT
jgi:predicted nucleic acid-binding protein